MELTRRQEEFMRNLLDLYREQQEPLHYSKLAERLGVSRFTAYDMLRLLEEKGFARSSYQLAEDKSGPGRAEIVYMPTERARRLLTRLSSEVPGEEWEAVKRLVLARVQRGEYERLAGRELAEEMLQRVPPDDPDSIRYCVELMTIIALRLRHGRGRQLLLAHLPDILTSAETACRANLTLLAGFALGILVDEMNDDLEWGAELMSHVGHYQKLVLAMDGESCRRLAARIADVFATLKK